MWESPVAFYCMFPFLFGVRRAAPLYLSRPGSVDPPWHGARGLLLVPTQDQGGPEACELAELCGGRDRERER